MEDLREVIHIHILNNTIDLEEPCWKCVDYFNREIEVDDCEVCNNKRFMLTPQGEAIIELVKAHLRVGE